MSRRIDEEDIPMMPPNNIIFESETLMSQNSNIPGTPMAYSKMNSVSHSQASAANNSGLLNKFSAFMGAGS